MLEQMLAVTGVLGLMAAALWWLRRRGLAQFTARRSRPRRLEVMERLPLTQQHSLHLVKLGGRAVLVATSPAGCSLLESVEWTRQPGEDL